MSTKISFYEHFTSSKFVNTKLTIKQSGMRSFLPIKTDTHKL